MSKPTALIIRSLLTCVFIFAIPGSTNAQINVTVPEKSGKSMLPQWFHASSSPWKSVPVSSATLPVFMAKYPGRTIGHQDWSETTLVNFLWLHTDLLSKTEKSLAILNKQRFNIAQTIVAAQSNHYDMTAAKALLAKSDEALKKAESSVFAIRKYGPPVIINSKKATPTSIVKLDVPRAMGSMAIESLVGARKALQAVIVEIARATKN